MLVLPEDVEGEQLALGPGEGVQVGRQLGLAQHGVERHLGGGQEVRLRVNTHDNVALTRQLTDAFLTADSGLS